MGGVEQIDLFILQLNLALQAAYTFDHYNFGIQ